MRRLADSAGTVEKLRQALLCCLNEREYRDVTISELSGRAGINRTTFYLLFGSKEELFKETCRSLVGLWFQRFFDLNIIRDTDSEKALFDELLSWLAQRRSALTRILNVRTDMFDGFLLFADEIEKKMAAQNILKAENGKKQKKYDLFIKIYSVSLASIIKWWLEEGEGFDEDEFHAMIERLRYKGYYSVLED
ncbi:MAG: TetR/AcrR family transcriptional regulator [Clostridia bacterium]|nr:TetR/AcrR family transcriptional regulator [Clostridia bacterium]